MLILSRKRDEQILIGSNITITVCEIRGRRVSIGVSAPKETRIQRTQEKTSGKRQHQSEH